MRFVGLSFSYVIVAVNVLVCSVTFSQSPSHTDLSYGTGQEVVDMYLAESPAPTPVYIWGHAKGQTHKRVPKDALSLCLDAGYSFLSIEANDDNHDGIQDLYIKEPWLKILDFVIANAAKYNIDPKNIFIGGRNSVCGFSLYYPERDRHLAATLERNILENAGYKVLVAADGEEACAIAESGNLDAIVSDVDMPRMDGIALTEWVRANERVRELPVILVTALHSQEDRLRGLEAGADAYIAKGTFDQNELLETMERLVG